MRKIKFCEWCGKEIKNTKSNRQKYHLEPQPNMDRSCSEYARLEKKTVKYNITCNSKVKLDYNKELGSKGTGLKSELPSDVLKAHRVLLNEFKRLGVKRKGFWCSKIKL